MTYTANTHHAGGVYRDGVPIAFTRGDDIDAPAEAERIAGALRLAAQIGRLTLTTETECGQCEGTGTTQSMSNLAEEPCAVCDGSGSVDGGPIEEGAGETLDALIEMARTIAAGAPCNTPPIRVLVALEGGFVQGIIADRAGVEAIVIDYDTEGTDSAELSAIPQDDGTTAEAIRSTWGAIDCDPAFIDGAIAAPSIEREEQPEPERCGSCEELRDAVGGSTHWNWQCRCCAAWNVNEAERDAERLTETRADPLRHVEIADAD